MSCTTDVYRFAYLLKVLACLLLGLGPAVVRAQATEPGAEQEPRQMSESEHSPSDSDPEPEAEPDAPELLPEPLAPPGPTGPATQAGTGAESTSLTVEPNAQPAAATSAQPFPQLPEPTDTEASEAWDPWAHPEAHARSHRGFFLRLGLGVGWGDLRGSHDPVTEDAATFSGLGLSGLIAVGGALTENLILHGDLYFSAILDADADGGTYGLVPGYEYRGDITAFAPGIGLTYYVMPINLYLSGSLGLSQAVWERYDGERQASRFGIATQFVVGKEWWVDPLWGLGVALQGSFMTAGDAYYDRVRGLAFAVLFSATYN